MIYYIIKVRKNLILRVLEVEMDKEITRNTGKDVAGVDPSMIHT